MSVIVAFPNTDVHQLFGVNDLTAAIPEAFEWEQSITTKKIMKMLVDAGAGTAEELARVCTGSGLGLFVRSMVGLDREAAKRAFDGFLTRKTLTANQIQFVNLMIDYLTQAGWMSPAQLYDSPFTDFSPRGVEGIFGAPAKLGNLSQSWPTCVELPKADRSASSRSPILT